MRKTTFIIGAGASTEFALPIGKALARRIGVALTEELTNADNRPILNSAMSTELIGDYGEASRDIAGGMVAARSIDRYLASRGDRPLVQAVGKRAIAYQIAMAERASPLGRADIGNWGSVREALIACEDTWLARLFALVHEGYHPKDAKGFLSQFSFITFNYDRCIEWYLTLALHHIMSLAWDEAETLVASIPIHHIYGSLGPLAKMPFGPTVERLHETAANIRTFMEAAFDDAAQHSRWALMNCENVVVLGYGFDPQNNAALFAHPLFESQRIAGTAMDVDSRDFNDFQLHGQGQAQDIGWARVRAADFISSEIFRTLLAS